MSVNSHRPSYDLLVLANPQPKYLDYYHTWQEKQCIKEEETSDMLVLCIRNDRLVMIIVFSVFSFKLVIPASLTCVPFSFLFQLCLRNLSRDDFCPEVEPMQCWS